MNVPVKIIFFLIQGMLSLACHQNEGDPETICKNLDFNQNPHFEDDVKILLVENATGTIAKDSFASLGKATEITITKSDIDGIEEGALCSAPKLASVNFLQNDKIPKLTKFAFKNCGKLKKIHVEGGFLENGALADMGSLETATFNDTIFPETLTKETFEGLKSLKYLSVRHSKFTGIDKNALDDLEKLEYLDLQGNGIKALSPGTFSELEKLKILDLSHNNLNSLSWNEFQGLKSLNVLFLDRNDFTEIDVDALAKSVPDLERIFLSGRKFSEEQIKEIDGKFAKRQVKVIYVDNDLATTVAAR